MEARTSPSPIERLPVELNQALLSHLPDLESLKKAALSCPIFFNTFRSNEEAIVHRVLLNYINPAILHDAMAVQESANVGKKGWTADTARKFIGRYIDRHQAMSPPSWKFVDVLPIAHFYGIISSFTLAFQKFAAGNLPNISDQSDRDRLGSWELTQRELNRIQRTLYRFEIYCNLFGDYDKRPFRPEEQESVFFAHFSPWENEQLGCIHDYLDRGLVYPAYVYMAMHHSEWLYCFTRMGNGVGPEYVQYGLSLGLAQIHKSALDADLDHMPNEAFFGGSNTHGLDYDFLDDAMGCIEAGPELDHFEEQVVIASHDRPIYQALIQDPDPGPEKTWRWIFWTDWIAHGATFGPRYSFRQWGYVMWDQARVERWGIFERSHEEVETLMPCPVPLLDRYTFESEIVQAKNEMKQQGRWNPHGRDYVLPIKKQKSEEFDPIIPPNRWYNSWAEIVAANREHEEQRRARWR